MVVSQLLSMHAAGYRHIFSFEVSKSRTPQIEEATKKANAQIVAK